MALSLNVSSPKMGEDYLSFDKILANHGPFREDRFLIAYILENDTPYSAHEEMRRRLSGCFKHWVVVSKYDWMTDHDLWDAFKLDYGNLVGGRFRPFYDYLPCFSYRECSLPLGKDPVMIGSFMVTIHHLANYWTFKTHPDEAPRRDLEDYINSLEISL